MHLQMQLHWLLATHEPQCKRLHVAANQWVSDSSPLLLMPPVVPAALQLMVSSSVLSMPELSVSLLL
jgi:hypothetical protein